MEIDEKITNAVDYDMYFKLSEVGPFKHLNKVAYNRVLHGENISIRKITEQKENHSLVVNKSLKRQNAYLYLYKPFSQDDKCRKYIFSRRD